MYQLQRVSCDVRGFGSFSFALAFGGMEFHGDVVENISMSSGSLSLAFEDMWRNGCTESPDWDSDIDMWTEGEEISEDDTRSLQQVWRGPCWEGLRPCLDPRDVLRMRTTASRWNVPCTCGPYDELPHRERANNPRGLQS